MKILVSLRFFFSLGFLLVINWNGIAQVTVNAALNNTTINTCNEFLIDSGGQGGPGYSNNEDITFTICSDNPGDQVTVTFNLFALSTVDTAPGNANNSDQMYVFDGPTTGANSLGNYGGTGLQGVVIQATPQNTSGCLTFQFVSNDTGTGQFTASASCNTPCATPQAGGFIVDGITPIVFAFVLENSLPFRSKAHMHKQDLIWRATRGTSWTVHKRRSTHPVHKFNMRLHSPETSSFNCL